MEYRFSLLYESMDNFLSSLQHIFHISTKLSPPDAEAKYTELLEARKAKVKFDPSWIVEPLHESRLRESTCMLVTPLASNPGRFLLTNKRMYFQPLTNIGSQAVEKWDTHKVQRIEPRRYMLREIGLEVFLDPGTSVFFTFQK